MTLEDHPSFPSQRELVQLLLQCADLADTLPQDPRVAMPACAQVVNEMFPNDRIRRTLCFTAACNVEVTASASAVFTIAADRLHQLIST